MSNSETAFPAQLLDGYQAFKSGRLKEERARYEMLAQHGQKPKTLIICCCDSRAAPETVFNAAPGELFVVRNVANIVPPHGVDDGYHATSAALEFAVQALAIENIVVMGHGRCGGVQAFLSQDEGIVEAEPLSPENYIGQWIALLKPAKEKMLCDENADFSTRKRAMEEAGVKQSIENLQTFPYIKKRVIDGSLTLHGAWFDISSGDLLTLDHGSGRFVAP